MHEVHRHLSYANVMSSIAVFAVLGGGAWAASKIDTADIQNGAVTKKKLHRNAVTGAKLRESSLAAVPQADSADVASIGVSPLAYAHVAADGTVDRANSRGVTNANILDDLGRAGTYCVTGLAGVKSAIVVPDAVSGAGADNGPAMAAIHLRSDFPDTPACAGARFMVSTTQALYADGVEPADASFFVWFFG